MAFEKNFNFRLFDRNAKYCRPYGPFMFFDGKTTSKTIVHYYGRNFRNTLNSPSPCNGSNVSVVSKHPPSSPFSKIIRFQATRPPENARCVTPPTLSFPYQSSRLSHTDVQGRQLHAYSSPIYGHLATCPTNTNACYGQRLTLVVSFTCARSVRES